jgi:hypothetical protein
MPCSMIAAAESSGTSAGTFASLRAGTTASSAYEPVTIAYATRSPTCTSATSLPTAVTVRAFRADRERQRGRRIAACAVLHVDEVHAGRGDLQRFAGARRRHRNILMACASAPPHACAQLPSLRSSVERHYNVHGSSCTPGNRSQYEIGRRKSRAGGALPASPCYGRPPCSRMRSNTSSASATNSRRRRCRRVADRRATRRRRSASTPKKSTAPHSPRRAQNAARGPTTSVRRRRTNRFSRST